MNRPDETTLHAWVDGELAPENAAQVGQWLTEHPDEAARVAAMQAQRASLQAQHVRVLEEPVPPQMPATITTFMRIVVLLAWPTSTEARRVSLVLRTLYTLL